MAKNASREELGRAYSALRMVPENAGQQGGPIEAGADFASMPDAAKHEFAEFSAEAG